MTFLNQLRVGSRKPKISLLIPFSGNEPQRLETLSWLVEYWLNALPDAEIIIGHSYKKPFCKTEAFNNAASVARGRVFVLLDADAYMDANVIEACTRKIIEELDRDNHIWFVPYRKLYRLQKWISEEIIESDPTDPLQLPSPPDKDMIEGDPGMAVYGRRYGAMVMVIPREAYFTLGGFDERFRGWGGEDASILRALDTLWGKHKSTNNDVLHLWHPTFGTTFRDRRWHGQSEFNPNDKLASAYHKAARRPSQMRKLVDESHKARGKRNILYGAVSKLTGRPPNTKIKRK